MQRRRLGTGEGCDRGGEGTLQGENGTSPEDRGPWRLTSSPNGVDYDAVEHCGFMGLLGSNLDVRRMAMATNGEWKVLVDILYCVA